MPLTPQECRSRLAANLKNIRTRLNIAQGEMAGLMSTTKHQLRKLEAAEADLTIQQIQSLTTKTSVKIVHVVTGVRLASSRTEDEEDMVDECHSRIQYGGLAELKFILSQWRLFKKHGLL